MIRRAVNAGNQPVVVLPMRGLAGAAFAVDTGFAGPLMLPRRPAARSG